MARPAGGPVPDIQASSEPGVYYVKTAEQGVREWRVGERYTLHKVLGEGSFSAVCLATDKQTGQQVALKQVSNVLGSMENAKRVLRECAILRRLQHPNIVRLWDVFLTPSATGGFVFRGGKLISTSVDLYMALEYCNQGDLFRWKGQMTELEVKMIMWQLLDALRSMHAASVWHRDIKSANILMALENGQRIAKLCDYGSARSARDRGHTTEPNSNANLAGTAGTAAAAAGGGGAGGGGAGTGQGGGGVGGFPGGGNVGQGGVAVGGAGGPAGGTWPNRSLDLDTLTSPLNSPSSKPGRPSGHGAGGRGLDALPRPLIRGGGGLQTPLTRAVCTPCYRAPEVIMSHGSYSSALDMWSLGCVFGELLQRVAYLGKSATPHLQVAPVIAVSGVVVTPKEGEVFEGPGNPTTRSELEALFSVVGTPPWATITAVVKAPSWARYLRRLPGRAPQLHRRFAPAGPAAVDLLDRMLEFDPSRRASAEEAMAHEYFDELREDGLVLATTGALEQATSSGLVPEEAATAAAGEAGGAGVSGLGLRLVPAGSAGAAAAAAAAVGSESMGEDDVRRHPQYLAGAGGGALRRSGSVDQDQGRGGVPGGDAPRGVRAVTPGSAAAPAGPPAAGAVGAMGAGQAQGRSRMQDSVEGMEVDGQQEGGSESQRVPLLRRGSRSDSSSGSGAASQGAPGTAGAAAAAAAAAAEGATAAATPRSGMDASEAEDPAQALAALEAELSTINSPSDPGDGLERLRQLLERECEQHRAQAEAEAAAAARFYAREATPLRGAGGSSGTLSDAEGAVSSGGAVPLLPAPGGGAYHPYYYYHAQAHGGLPHHYYPPPHHLHTGQAGYPIPGVTVGQRARGVGRRGAGRRAEGLREDPGNSEDPAQIGKERIPHHADAEQADLKAEKHLRAGRHGEWVATSLADSMARAPGSSAWGVTLTPPGVDARDMDPGLMEAIRAQHGR